MKCSSKIIHKSSYEKCHTTSSNSQIFMICIQSHSMHVKQQELTVVSQGAGGRIMLKTERSLVDGSVRTLKKRISSLLVEVNKVNIL